MPLQSKHYWNTCEAVLLCSEFSGVITNCCFGLKTSPLAYLRLCGRHTSQKFTRCVLFLCNRLQSNKQTKQSVTLLLSNEAVGVEHEFQTMSNFTRLLLWPQKVRLGFNHICAESKWFFSTLEASRKIIFLKNLTIFSNHYGIVYLCVIFIPFSVIGVWFIFRCGYKMHSQLNRQEPFKGSRGVAAEVWICNYFSQKSKLGDLSTVKRGRPLRLQLLKNP